MSDRAARVLSRLYERNPEAVMRIKERTRGMTTPLGVVKKLIETGESMMASNPGAVPQLRAEDETTEVVIDLNLERYLREALKQRAFMRDDFIDEIFEWARELAQKGK